MASFMYTCSQAMKTHTDAAAGKLNISTAELVRRAIAAFTGYDLSAEVEGRTRRTKYATKAERTAARKARKDKRNAEDKALLEQLRKGLHQADISHIAASIQHPDAPVSAPKKGKR